MAQLIIDIPDAQFARVRDAFAVQNGYQETVLQPDGTNLPNPVTKAAFMKRCVIAFIRDSVRARERTVAAMNAGNAAAAAVDTEVVIT